tara:strand:- start:197 stop:352 length:156 start_codon:yes stop_codon:yes gene_type:complete
MYYYIFTGIHFLHLLIGMGVLGYMILRLGRNNTLAKDLPVLESGGTIRAYG